jgi:hypothetical protein
MKMVLLIMKKKIQESRDFIKNNRVQLNISIVSLIISLAIAVTGILVTLHVNNKNLKENKLNNLNLRLDNINAAQLNYPYLEDSTFIASQCEIKMPKSDSSLRYVIYCEKVFNLIQDLTEQYYYNKEEIENFVDVDALIQQHQCWIRNEEKDPLIVKAYPTKFLNFINGYFK